MNLYAYIAVLMAVPVILSCCIAALFRLVDRKSSEQNKFSCEPVKVCVLLAIFWVTVIAKLGARQAVEAYNTEMQVVAYYITLYNAWTAFWLCGPGAGFKGRYMVLSGLLGAAACILLYTAMAIGILSILV